MSRQVTECLLKATLHVLAGQDVMSNMFYGFNLKLTHTSVCDKAQAIMAKAAKDLMELAIDEAAKS